MKTDLPVQTSTLVELLRQRSRQQAEQTAYIFLGNNKNEEKRITYAELDRQARTIAASLQRSGTKNKRALLLYPPGLDYIAAFFGCLYAGVVAIPSFPPNSARLIPRTLAIVENAHTELILTSSAQLPVLERWFEHVPALRGFSWLTTDRLESALAETWQDPSVDGETLALLQYTSGSTSTPRGVMLNHQNLIQNLKLIEQAMGISPACCGVIWLPPYHDMGLIGGILESLYASIPTTLMSPVSFLQRPFKWLQAVSGKSGVISGGPNFAYDLCVRKITPAQRATLDLSGWKVAFCGAEPIHAETLERFAETFASCGFKIEAFYPTYGLAEATLIASGGNCETRPVIRTFHTVDLEKRRAVPVPPDLYNARPLVGCGQSLLDQRIVIADPATLTVCPPDQIGEIWISGKSVAQGYWSMPTETQHTFQAYLAESGEGPFMRTGDLGFFHDGELFPTGRIKDLIIIRGHNYYPQDIELAVDTCHPAIRPGCSVAFSVNVQGSEQLVVGAEIGPHFRPARDQGESDPEECSSGKPLAAQDVITSIRQAIAEQFDLHVYQVLLLKYGSLSKTSSGKIQRFACREAFLTKSLGAWDE